MTISKRKEWKHFRYMTIFLKGYIFQTPCSNHFYIACTCTRPSKLVDPLRPINYNNSGIWNMNKFNHSHLTILRSLPFAVIISHTVCVSGVIKMNTTCTIITMRNILLGNKINKTQLISNVDLHWNARPNWIKTMWLYDWRRPRCGLSETSALEHHSFNT